MEQTVNKKMYENSLIFKKSLDQIIEKYSQFQDQDGGIEVDLNSTELDAVERYMNLSITELRQQQSKNLTRLSEESLCASDITGDSQLDVAYIDGERDETCGSTSQFPEEDDEASLSLPNLSSSISVSEFQPEDQDEELQMSLSSNGSCLVELYPSMVSRLEKAWHQQHVSVAADSVLKRYRRWRQQSKRRDPNKTFDVTLKHTNSNPKRLSSKGSTNSRIKQHHESTETTPRSALQTVTSLHDGQQSNMKKRLLRQEVFTHVRVIDFSGTHSPKESSLNETFTVCELSPPKALQEREHVSAFAAYPSQPHHPTAEAPVEPSFMLKRLSDSSCSSQRATCSTYEAETPAVRARSDIYGSPLRQSPSKSRLLAGLCRSPRVFSTSPRRYSVDRCSEEPVKPRLSSSLSSCPERPVVQLKLLQPQDSIQPSRPQLCSPQPARAADGHHRRRRHASFDSSLALNPASYSPKKVDEDFMKLYHKFVCQNKSPFFNGPPCRLCARNSETSGYHSSSTLVALALSPHRFALRKRYRELEWDSSSQSKRLRNEHCTSSPGSKRYRREMLMQRRSLSEMKLPRGGLSYSPSKPRFQQQEACTSPRQPASDARFHGLGGSFENRGASGYSSRYWR